MKIAELENYKDPKYYWDKRAYLRVKIFFETKLFHSEGQFAGKPFKLNSWQDEFIANVFGVKCKDTGLRRYRSASIWIPKGGGKTEFAAGLGLYGTCADGEMAAEGYVAAKSKDQAETCYNKGLLFVSNSPDLKDKFSESYDELVYSRTLTNKVNGSTFTDVCHFGAISSEGKNQHGKSPHIVILDEIWNQTNSELYTALSGSRRSRLQSLFITISTAGERKNEFAWGRWQYDMKCFKNPNHDESHYSVIYCATEEDDWRDENTWFKANPSLGITPTIEHLRGEFRKASESPVLEKDFKQFHLNIWVSSVTAWIAPEIWLKGKRELVEDDFYGQECSLGLDMSETTDLTALSRVFKRDDGFYVFVDYWMPFNLIQTRTFDDQMPYDQWAQDGWLRTCDGNRINQEDIIDRLEELSKIYRCSVLEYDKWRASYIAEKAKKFIAEVAEFEQKTKFYHAPCEFMEGLIKDVRLFHNNPILDWNAENVEIWKDGNGGKKPIKSGGVRGRNMRIDGIPATLMALAPHIEGAKAEKKLSVYSTRKAIII